MSLLDWICEFIIGAGLTAFALELWDWGGRLWADKQAQWEREAGE